MPRCRVVVPETVRLPLSDGDFLDVWKELNAGQYLDFIVAMTDRRPFAKVQAYVLAWSFVGVDGTPVPWDPDTDAATRLGTLRSLDKGTMREMIAALDRHEAAEEAALAEKKRTPPVAPASTGTSTSPDAAAGPLSTSAL